MNRTRGAAGWLAIACLVACAGGGDGPSSTAFDPTNSGNDDTGPVATSNASDPDDTGMVTGDGTGQPPPDGSCCQVSPSAGCGNPEIETCVCTIEPSCCQSVWNQDCVDLAGTPCGDPACDGPPPTTGTTGNPPGDSSGEPPPMLTCDELAAQEGWMFHRCESGGGTQCNGVGTPTTDCDFCCEYCGEPDAVSCGDLAMNNGWAAANCEWNGNGACGGSGTPTCDCNHCCEVN